MASNLSRRSYIGEKFSSQYSHPANPGLIRGEYLCRRSIAPEASRGLEPVRQSLQSGSEEVWQARHRFDGKPDVKKSSFLPKLEQEGHRSSQLGCSVTRSRLVSLGETLPLPTIPSYRSLLNKDRGAESAEYYYDTSLLARQGVVQQVHPDGCGGEKIASLQVPDMRLVHRQPSTGRELVQLGRCSSFWQLQHCSQQLSGQARDLVEASWRPNTESTYSSGWHQWVGWASLHGVQEHSPGIADVLNYLSTLFENGRKYRTINCARSMLSSTLLPIDGFPVGKHPMVTRLMKGVFNKRPPTKLLFPSWSVKQVLIMLSSWSPARSLSFKLLSYKCVMLLALVTGKRASSISKLSLKQGYLELGESTIVLQPLGLEKNTRPGHTAAPIVIEAYNQAPEICPVHYLKAYIIRSKELRKNETLFVSVNRPHNTVSPATVCRWLKSVITMSSQSGSGGSTRSVTTSTGIGRGLTIDSIVKAGDWARSRTFKNHYYKPVPLNELQFSILSM